MTPPAAPTLAQLADEYARGHLPAGAMISVGILRDFANFLAARGVVVAPTAVDTQCPTCGAPVNRIGAERPGDREYAERYPLSDAAARLRDGRWAYAGVSPGPSAAAVEALAIVEQAYRLWDTAAKNYECSAPHDVGSKASCVAARDALGAVQKEVAGAGRREGLMGHYLSELDERDPAAVQAALAAGPVEPSLSGPPREPIPITAAQVSKANALLEQYAPTGEATTNVQVALGELQLWIESDGCYPRKL